jgi:hypothetical protein
MHSSMWVPTYSKNVLAIPTNLKVDTARPSQRWYPPIRWQGARGNGRGHFYPEDSMFLKTSVPIRLQGVTTQGTSHFYSEDGESTLYVPRNAGTRGVIRQSRSHFYPEEGESIKIQLNTLIGNIYLVIL